VAFGLGEWSALGLGLAVGAAARGPAEIVGVAGWAPARPTAEAEAATHSATIPTTWEEFAVAADKIQKAGFIAVAHGEGRAEFASTEAGAALDSSGLVAARFVDHHGNPTEHYPENPNGSPLGITAITTPDGRATIIMPHPERVFRSVQLSWHPDDAGHDSPWMRLFRNARVFVG